MPMLGGPCSAVRCGAVQRSAVLDGLSLRRVQVRWVEAFQFPMAADGGTGWADGEKLGPGRREGSNDGMRKREGNS